MNDFDYDCYQKKVIAQSAKKKVRKKKGCTLPSDYLTEAEKKKLNGEVEIMNPESLKRPIKYGYFKMLVKEQQEGYLNWLLEAYDATLNDIGKMMGTNGNTLLKYCNGRNLDILRRPGHTMSKKKIDAWNEFCGIDIPEIAEEPVTDTDNGWDLEEFAPIDYETFKKLTKSVQESYLTQLVQEFAVTKADIAKMMGAVPVTFRLYISNHGIHIQASRPERTKEKKAAWQKFCGIEEIESVMDVPAEPDEVLVNLLEEAKAEKEEQFDKAIEFVKPSESEKTPVEPEQKKTPVMDILPEKSLRKKTIVNYEYHMEFQNLTRWGELFEVLKSMPLPEDGVVHIEVSSKKPDEKSTVIGFAPAPETAEV